MKENKTLIKILNILFIISCPFFTLLFINDLGHSLFKTIPDYKYISVNLVASFIISIFLVFKFQIIKKIIKKTNSKQLLITLFFTILFLLLYLCMAKDNVNYIQYLINILFSKQITFQFGMLILGTGSFITTFILICFLIQLVIPAINNFYKQLTKIEKTYLLVITILAIILTGIIYSNTKVFYNPGKNDVLYTTDSYFLNATNAYFNVNSAENDIRQPLLGVFSLPFSTIAKIISCILFYIPNIYILLMNIIQIILLGISFLLISKMLNLSGKKQIIFLLLIFLTFPSIIYSFILEQYIFSLFYLILTIYIGLSPYKKINYSYIPATGSILTSGVMLPLISKSKKFKTFALDIFKCFIAFVVVFVLFGRLLILVNINGRIDSLSKFSGKNVELNDRMLQYSNFLSSTIYAPYTEEHLNTEVNYMEYILSKTTNVNILGILILILVSLGLIVNRKNKLCIVSALWILFSFILLCAFGWGTEENGLVLYTLYFSWAFIVLIFSLINKLFNKIPKLEYTMYISLIISMVIINIPAFINMISFGIKYYPILN